MDSLEARTLRRTGLLLMSLGVWALTTSSSAHALTIIPTFDSTVTSNPNAAAVQADVQTAINFYQSTFTAPVTVQMQFSEGAGSFGQGLGGTSSTSLVVQDYNTVYKPALLAADATTLTGRTAISNLPSVAAGTLVLFPTAEGRALGFNTQPGIGAFDGLINLGSANQYVIPPPGVALGPTEISGLQVIEHEMNEVLGVGAN